MSLISAAVSRTAFLNFVIVGGGPTGVEVAGALAEMKKYILPKDYPEFDIDEIDIILIQGGPLLLEGMSKESSSAAASFLKKLGVKIKIRLFFELSKFFLRKLPTYCQYECG